MPEIAFPVFREGWLKGKYIDPLIFHLTKVYDDDPVKQIVINDQDFETAVQFCDREMIGAGSNSRIVSHKNREKVLSIGKFPQSSYSVRTRYYEQRIAHYLWPHNIPHVYSVFRTNTEPFFWGTVRQKIDKMPFVLESHTEETKSYALLRKLGMIKHPFQTVIDQRNAWNLPLSFDHIGSNLRVGKDGNVYYVDEVSFFYFGAKPYDFRPFMKANGHSQRDIEIVMNASARLHALRQGEYERARKESLIQSSARIIEALSDNLT